MFKWITFFIFIIVITGFIIILNPKTHKNIKLSAADFSVTNYESAQKVDTKILHKDNETKTVLHDINNTSKKLSVKNQPNSNKLPDTGDYLQQIKEREAKKFVQIQTPKKETRTSEISQTQETTQNSQTTKTLVTKKQNSTAKTSAKSPVKTPSKPSASANKPAAPVKNIQTPKKVLTQQEETIAWNKWRSDVDNKIHASSVSKMPSDIPLGTRYKYSFTVDKNRNITNIKVQILSYPVSENVKKGKEVITAVISGLQKDSVLEFPEGTQRTSADVSTSARLGTANKYSTPADYSDYEKITKYDYK